MGDHRLYFYLTVAIRLPAFHSPHFEFDWFNAYKVAFVDQPLLRLNDRRQLIANRLTVIVKRVEVGPVASAPCATQTTPTPLS